MTMSLQRCAPLLVYFLVAAVALQTANAREQQDVLILAPTFSTSDASLQEYYAHRSTCLKVSAVPYCPWDYGVFYDVESDVMRTEVSCCHNSDHSSSAFEWQPGVSPAVGSCDWSLVYAYDYDTSTEPAGLHGTFQVLCRFNSNAKDCIEPSCNNMILSGQGSIYHVSNLVTDNPDEPLMEVCYKEYGGLPRKSNSTGVPGKMRSERLQPAAAHAGNARKHDPNGASEQLYRLNFADIMSGPITLSSTTSGKAWRGWLEVPLGWDVDGPITASEAAAAGLNFVRANDFNIKIFDKEEAY